MTYHELVEKYGHISAIPKDLMTEEICLAAVEENAYSIRYVHNQTEAICLAAVKRNGDSIQYIKADLVEKYGLKKA